MKPVQSAPKGWGLAVADERYQEWDLCHSSSGRHPGGSMVRERTVLIKGR